MQLRTFLSNGMRKVPRLSQCCVSSVAGWCSIAFSKRCAYALKMISTFLKIGKLDIHDPAPEDVLDLLKTATPADFNNSPNLEWRYVILKGVVWQISRAPEDYHPQSEDEANVLELLGPEHPSVDKMDK